MFSLLLSLERVFFLFFLSYFCIKPGRYWVQGIFEMDSFCLGAAEFGLLLCEHTLIALRALTEIFYNVTIIFINELYEKRLL